jgi:voltage-gated potassium channel
VIVIEESRVSETWKTIGGVLNWVVWTAFAVEAAVMLAVVPSKKEWLRRHPLEVIIVLLTPPFLPAGLQALRALRLLRVLRLFRLAQVVRRTFSLEGLRYAAVLAVLIAVAGGAAFSTVEKDKTTWDGVWWAATTMTTVAYGDQYPVTMGGRVIGIALMLVGIGFVAILTGAVAERFLAQQVEDVAEAQEEAAVQIEASEGEILAELRAVRARLEMLESRLAVKP